MDYDVPPHMTVEVGFDWDYLRACERFGGGFALREKWEELANILAHRPGWHFDVVNDGEALWSLGAFGGSLVNISITRTGKFGCYDHEHERESEDLDTIEEVEAWLRPREERARRLPDAEIWLSRDNWRLLRELNLRVSVTALDGSLIGRVDGIPLEATFGSSVAEVLRRVREMICSAVGAPADVASDLRLHVRLDPDAARLL